MSETHAINRTSPKGEPFVGACIKCGMTNLPMSAVNDECSNPSRMTQHEALFRAIEPPERVYAFTVPGDDFPAYVNAKVEPSNGDRSRRLQLEGDDWLVLTVRSPKGEDGAAGPTASIRLTRVEAVNLCEGIHAVLTP